MKKLAGFKSRLCDNKNCRWSKEERPLGKERLSVDRFSTIFMVGTFMCECGFHVRVEPVFVEVKDGPTRRT